MTPEPSIFIKCMSGAKFDAQLDGDGDLCVCITNDTSAAMYLNGRQAAELRDWLINVLPASALETGTAPVIDTEYCRCGGIKRRTLLGQTICGTCGS